MLGLLLQCHQPSFALSWDATRREIDLCSGWDFYTSYELVLKVLEVLLDEYGPDPSRTLLFPPFFALGSIFFPSEST